MEICFLTKRKRNIGKFTAKLTFLWYNKKPTSLQSNGMAAIPKISGLNSMVWLADFLLHGFFNFFQNKKIPGVCVLPRPSL